MVYIKEGGQLVPRVVKDDVDLDAFVEVLPPKGRVTKEGGKGGEGAGGGGKGGGGRGGGKSSHKKGSSKTAKITGKEKNKKVGPKPPPKAKAPRPKSTQFMSQHERLQAMKDFYKKYAIKKAKLPSSETPTEIVYEDVNVVRTSIMHRVSRLSARLG